MFSKHTGFWASGYTPALTHILHIHAQTPRWPLNSQLNATTADKDLLCGVNFISCHKVMEKDFLFVSACMCLCLSACLCACTWMCLIWFPVTCYHNTCTQTRPNTHTDSNFSSWLGDRLLYLIFSLSLATYTLLSNAIPLGCQQRTLKAGCDMMIKNPTLICSFCGSRVYGLG